MPSLPNSKANPWRYSCWINSTGQNPRKRLISVTIYEIHITSVLRQTPPFICIRGIMSLADVKSAKKWVHGPLTTAAENNTKSLLCRTVLIPSTCILFTVHIGVIPCVVPVKCDMNTKNGLKLAFTTIKCFNSDCTCNCQDEHELKVEGQAVYISVHVHWLLHKHLTAGHDKWRRRSIFPALWWNIKWGLLSLTHYGTTYQGKSRRDQRNID